MKPVRRTARATAWIAILAILLAALAPSMARALSSPQKAMPWTEICTVAGMQASPATEPVSGSGQHDAAAFKHCAFCLTNAGSFALPAATLDVLPVADDRTAAFPPSAAIPTPRFTRTAAQPRAPPVIS